MSDTTEDTTQDTGLPDEEDTYREPMRRDHFPIEKGVNQQDMDYQAELAAEENADMRERNVKWPEVDSQEALDAKIDEEQTDKDQRILDAAREADEAARDAADTNA